MKSTILFYSRVITIFCCYCILNHSAPLFAFPAGGSPFTGSPFSGIQLSESAPHHRLPKNYLMADAQSNSKENYCPSCEQEERKGPRFCENETRKSYLINFGGAFFGIILASFHESSQTEAPPQKVISAYYILGILGGIVAMHYAVEGSCYAFGD